MGIQVLLQYAPSVPTHNVEGDVMAYRYGYSNRPTFRWTATSGIAAAIVLGFLFCFFSNGRLAELLSFSTLNPLLRPWTFLTFPLAYPMGAILSALFGVLWLMGIGSAVENELGKGRFVAFWLIMTFLGATMVWIGSIVTGQSGGLWTAWMPLAAVTVAWGTRNPNAAVQFMFVLPLTGKWLAWLAAILVFFGTTPALAPFAASPLLLAYFFAANRLAFAPWSGPSRYDPFEKRREKRLMDLVDDSMQRKKEREERERLRRLLEGPVADEEER
jgi:hypothetical protein